jgi:rhodanese-related sulfurtransferase/CBS domain-containing protein
MSREIDRHEVRQLLTTGAQLVEVLPEKQYQRRHIAGAVNLPLAELGERARAELDPGRPVIVYCYDALCDLSGRAAARLESLGFTDVYNYHSSKVDWFANGLPAESDDADRPQLSDVAERDVPTCTPDETAAAVRDRLGDSDLCLVVSDKRILLGVLSGAELSTGDNRPVVELMRDGPTTHRPDVSVAEAADMLREHPEPRVIVTNADGALVGLADPDRIIRSA